MECVLRQFHASNSGVGSINTDTSDKSAISDLFVAELVDTALTVSSQTLQRSTNVKHSSVFPRPCRADTVPAKSEKYRFPLISPTVAQKSPTQSPSSSTKSHLISSTSTRSLNKSTVKPSSISSPLKSVSSTEYKVNLELDQRAGQPDKIHPPSNRY